MRVLSTIVAVLLAVQALHLNQVAAAPPLEAVGPNSRASIFDDLMREFVEFLKMQMTCGYPAAGIPPLAPYHVDRIEYDYHQHPLQVSFNVTDLTITGLNDFDVVVLTWNNIRQRLTFDFNFNDIKLTGNYELDSHWKVKNTQLNFYGDGLLHFELQNFRAHGDFRLKPLRTGGGMQMYDFNVQLDVGAAISETTGIMNSPGYTKFFNAWVEEFLRIIFEESVDEVSAAVEGFVVPRMNTAIWNKIPFWQLSGIIMGLVQDVLPTEPIC